MLLARIISILPALLLLPVGVGFIVTPAETAIGFGFIFADLSTEAQNAIIRDFTGFFIGISAMCILGAITMKYIWLAAPALVFLIVLIAHSIAALYHGTGFTSAIRPEIVLFILCALGSYLIYRQEHQTPSAS